MLLSPFGRKVLARRQPLVYFSRHCNFGPTLSALVQSRELKYWQAGHFEPTAKQPRYFRDWYGVRARIADFGGLVAQSVEQRPFKPLVLGSSPSQPTTFLMAWVYLLRGASGRSYIAADKKYERLVLSL